jgi:nucleotide-binding universal stress UspA family protein
VRIETTLAKGEPAREILELARRIQPDVICAGSHGYGFFSRLLMGSTSTALLREAECSVLIALPRAEHPERQSALAGGNRVADKAEGRS